MSFPYISPEYQLFHLIDHGGQADVYEVLHVLSGGWYAARLPREAWDPRLEKTSQSAATVKFGPPDRTWCLCWPTTSAVHSRS